MRIAVLGATGLTGRELTTQALARGYQVTALARDPARLQDLACPALTLARANVRDPDSVYAAVEGADALVSGLGVGPCDPPETLVEGARVAVSAGVPRIVWLGALGTGASRGVARPVFGPLLGWALRRELAAKVEADGLVVVGGATVVHAGRLTNTQARHTYMLTPAGLARPRLLPPSISRADVAALMLDEAVAGQFPGETVVALPCVGYFAYPDHKTASDKLRSQDT